VVGVFVVAIVGMAAVEKQFFPTSDRPEVLVEVQMPYGTSIEQTSAATAKVESWLAEQPEARIVTAYIGQGAPRFFLAMSPELPDPSFAKIVVLTDGETSRDALKLRLRQAVADGLAPEARVRVTQIVFGPPSPFPVAFRVMGPEPEKLRDIAAKVRAVMQATPEMRTVNTDWGERVPVLHFSLDQDRLQTIGLTSSDVGQQLQFLLSGIPITEVREDIRSVEVIARSAGNARLTDSALTDRNRRDPHGRPDPPSPRSHADDHRARRHRRGSATAGRVDGRLEGASADRRGAPGRVPDRGRRLDRGIR
jgi:multidrug efflux pump subunit AcrB